MKTSEVIAMMMQENTGTHPLDSGGSNGRKWQQLAGVDMDKLPEAIFDEYGYKQSMYHYLSDHLRYNKEFTESYHEYDKQFPDTHYVATLSDWFDEHPEYTVIESNNTYNFETTLDGIFQYWRFEDANGDEHIVLQTHNGADARGGYSKPFIFDYRADDYHEFASGLQNANVYCDKCANRWWTDWRGGWESDDTDFDPMTLWNNETGSYTCTCGGSIKGGY
jgi:hypothetical protein